MSLHRKIDLNTAMRDTRNDRVTPAPGFLAARSMEVACLDRMAKEAAMVPFVVDTSFDRSAIMKAAVAQARLQKAGFVLLFRGFWSSPLSGAFRQFG